VKRRELFQTLAPDRRRFPLASPKGLSREEAEALASRIMELSSADETQVNINSGWTGNTRFAVNRITTAGTSDNVSATVTARFGRRSASVTTNRFDEASLAEVVKSAAELARLAPEDPELMPLLGPQTYMPSEGYFDSTSNLDASSRGEVAGSAIRLAKQAGDLKAAGFLQCTAGSFALANSAGLFSYQAATSLDYSLTVRTDDGTGSGWAGRGARDWSTVPYEALNRIAVDKAQLSREPRSLEPGTYTVVLEPQAVSDLISLLAQSLNARTADEGRSAFAAPAGGTRIGEKIVDSRITLRSDPQGLGSAPFAARLLAPDRRSLPGYISEALPGSRPQNDDGLPLEPITWIEDGVLHNLSYSRFWAEKQGVKPTGPPGSLRMSGEENSLEDLIRGTRRGVLVTRLWYIRNIDPRTILYTGLTRDGNFLIEDGQIVHPVNNFRWNDSPLSAFSSLEAMSRPVRVRANREVPAVRVGEFTFSSVSEAV
jgi:predicted Zn-dependent protease